MIQDVPRWRPECQPGAAFLPADCTQSSKAEGLAAVTQLVLPCCRSLQAAIGSLFDTAAITADTCPSTLGNPEFLQQSTFQGGWQQSVKDLGTLQQELAWHASLMPPRLAEPVLWGLSGTVRP